MRIAVVELNCPEALKPGIREVLWVRKGRPLEPRWHLPARRIGRMSISLRVMVIDPPRPNWFSKMSGISMSVGREMLAHRPFLLEYADAKRYGVDR